MTYRPEAWSGDCICWSNAERMEAGVRRQTKRFGSQPPCRILSGMCRRARILRASALGEALLEKFEDGDVFSRETTIARHLRDHRSEDRIVYRVCRRQNDGRQCSGCLPAGNTREHIT